MNNLKEQSLTQMVVHRRKSPANKIPANDNAIRITKPSQQANKPRKTQIIR